MMMWRSLLTFGTLLCLPAAAVQQLPSVAATEIGATEDVEWWARVGDRIFYTPPQEAGLSQRIGDYYYAMGSHTSLTQEMQARRVGGSGRWHIFHLPEGPNALKGMRHSGSRRSSLSSLIQLQAGTHLETQFPDYEVSRQYTHPLTPDAQNLERELVGIITPELLMKYVAEISSNKDDRGRITRSYNNPGAQKNAQQYLQETFASFGLRSCVQRFRAHGNVVAIIPGTGAGSLTIGAHYDSRPFDRPAPGAEDNGSGVAGLLALAKMLAKAFADGKNKPEKTINLVGFAAEEPGLVGSEYFATQLARGMQPKMQNGEPQCEPKTSFLQVLRKDGSQGYEAEKMEAHSAIVLDEIGWKTPKFSRETVNLESYDRPGTIELMDHLKQASVDHNGESLRVEHSGHPFGSDHMSFLERAIPGVLCINGDDEAYPNYHQSSDTIDHVNGDYMSRIIKMVGGAALRVAGVQ